MDVGARNSAEHTLRHKEKNAENYAPIRPWAKNAKYLPSGGVAIIYGNNYKNIYSSDGLPETHCAI